MTDNNDKTIKSMFKDLKVKDIQALLEANGSDPKQALELFKQTAPIILMVLDNFMLKNGKQQISDAVTESYNSAEDFLRTDLPLLLFMFKMLDKSDVIKMLDQFTGQISNVTPEETVKAQKEMVSKVSEDFYLKLYGLIIDILPPKMLSFYLSLHGVEDKQGMLDYALRERELFLNSSIEKLSQKKIALNFNIDAEELYSLITDVVNNMSANGAESLATLFNKHLKPQDIEAVAFTGIDLLRDFCQAAANGSDLQLTSIPSLDKFVSSLREAFEKIENVITESDVIPEKIKIWAKSTAGAYAIDKLKP